MKRVDRRERHPINSSSVSHAVVSANRFAVNVNLKALYSYKVDFQPRHSAEIRRNLIDKLRQGDHLDRHLPVYDGRETILFAQKLPFDKKEFEVEYSSCKYTVSLTFSRSDNLEDLIPKPQRLAQALNGVLRATPCERNMLLGRMLFPEDTVKHSIDHGAESWRGYHQSLRPWKLGADGTYYGESLLSLNIDASNTIVYESTELVERFGFNLSSPLSDMALVKVEKALKGIKVKYKRGGVIRKFVVNGVSKEPLEYLRFKYEEKEASITSYFRDNHNITFQYPNLPALRAGSSSRPMLLPIELCEIIAGQRYKQPLDDSQELSLAKATCLAPHARQEYIKKIVNERSFKEDRFVREFGIVAKDLTRVAARVLPAPMVDNDLIGKVTFWSCLTFSDEMD